MAILGTNGRADFFGGGGVAWGRLKGGDGGYGGICGTFIFIRRPPRDFDGGGCSKSDYR